MTVSSRLATRPDFLLFAEPDARGGPAIVNHWPIPDDQAWRQLIEKLDGFRRLGPDWDGQGADPVDPALVSAAIRLALELARDQVVPADRVLAGFEGAVSFEWIDRAYSIEVEVIGPHEAEMREVDPLSRTSKSGSIHW